MRLPRTAFADHLAVEVIEGRTTIQLNLKVEYSFFCSAADREHAVGWNSPNRLAKLGIHSELALTVLCAFDPPADYHSVFGHLAAQRFPDLRIFADPFGHNVTRSFQSLLFRI